MRQVNLQSQDTVILDPAHDGTMETGENVLKHVEME